MKISMEKVLDLKALYETICKQSMPIKLSYKFSKLYTPILSEADFFSKEMNKIVDEYAEKDESGRIQPTQDGKGVQIKSGCMQKVQEKITELNEIEVDVGDIQFTLEELSGLELSLEQVNLLMPFINETIG